MQAVRAAHRKRSAQRVGAPINPSASRADSATNEVDTLRGDAPGQLVQARTRHATANEIDRYLGTEENAMNQGHGHKANDMFAPEGAWQSDASASKKCLGYKPFGSLLPGRNYSSDSYAHGFNGMRKDDEIHGATGTSYDFGARLYDPRVAAWLSLDPQAGKHPELSPYAYVNRNPITCIDPDGEDYIYTVRFIKDKSGTIIKKVVDVQVNIKVLNLTTKTVGLPDFSAAEQRSNSTFGYQATSLVNDPADASKVYEVPTEVNVNLTFSMAKSLADLREGDNALFVTENIRNSSTGHAAGLAQYGGNVAMVESQYLGKPEFYGLVLHEIGHLLNQDDGYTTKNGVVDRPGTGLMGALVSEGRSAADSQLSQRLRTKLAAHQFSSNGKRIDSEVKQSARDFVGEHADYDDKSRLKEKAP